MMLDANWLEEVKTLKMVHHKKNPWEVDIFFIPANNQNPAAMEMEIEEKS